MNNISYSLPSGRVIDPHECSQIEEKLVKVLRDYGLTIEDAQSLLSFFSKHIGMKERL